MELKIEPVSIEVIESILDKLFLEAAILNNNVTDVNHRHLLSLISMGQIVVLNFKNGDETEIVRYQMALRIAMLCSLHNPNTITCKSMYPRETKLQVVVGDSYQVFLNTGIIELQMLLLDHWEALVNNNQNEATTVLFSMQNIALTLLWAIAYRQKDPFQYDSNLNLEMGKIELEKNNSTIH